jgi:hypothetical protein
MQVPLSRHWKTHLGIRSVIRAKRVKAQHMSYHLHVAALVLHERKTANDHADDIDLIANMKQAGASCWQQSENPQRLLPRM